MNTLSLTHTHCLSLRHIHTHTLCFHLLHAHNRVNAGAQEIVIHAHKHTHTHTHTHTCTHTYIYTFYSLLTCAQQGQCRRPGNCNPCAETLSHTHARTHTNTHTHIHIHIHIHSRSSSYMRTTGSMQAPMKLISMRGNLLPSWMWMCRKRTSFSRQSRCNLDDIYTSHVTYK